MKKMGNAFAIGLNTVILVFCIALLISASKQDNMWMCLLWAVLASINAFILRNKIDVEVRKMKAAKAERNAARKEVRKNAGK